MIQPFEAITFETGLNKFRAVNTVEQAAQYLLESWHQPRSPMYVRARKVCLGALAGRGRPENAREAFLDA